MQEKYLLTDPFPKQDPITLPEINIAPEKAYFQVLLLLVSGSIVYIGSCNYHRLDLKKKQLAKWLLAAWHSEHCYHCPWPRLMSCYQVEGERFHGYPPNGQGEAEEFIGFAWKSRIFL